MCDNNIVWHKFTFNTFIMLSFKSVSVELFQVSGYLYHFGKSFNNLTPASFTKPKDLSFAKRK